MPMTQSDLIFRAMLSHRDSLNAHENYTRFHETMNTRQVLRDAGIPSATIEKKFPITACNQQRYFYNRYELASTEAYIDRHCNREKEAVKQDAVAAYWYEQYQGADEQAQAEDDARCARAEAREIAIHESYYR